MRTPRSFLASIPPLLVGASIAGAAEISAGLLLYSTEGFLPALTLILTVETGALALGLWSGTFQLGEGVVEQVRRRWLFSLVTFAVAAAFSTGMTFMDELLTGGLGQGLGLGLLGSLPLFALGSLLGAMARSGKTTAPAAASVGIPSVVGLAVGFLLTGGVLLPNLAPYTLFLVYLTVLSGGALLQGWVLDERPVDRLLAREWTARGELKAEVRAGGREDDVWRILLENDRVRGAEDLGGAPGRDWERAVLAAVRGEGKEPGAVLHIGGGSGTVARLLTQEFLEPRVVVLEGSEELVRLAREHLYPFSGWRTVTLLVGDPWSLLRQLDDSFALILLDANLLPSLGRLPVLPEDGWEELARLAGREGSVVLGGLGGAGAPGRVPMSSLMDRGSTSFERVALYQGEEGAFLLLSGPEAPQWSPALPGFQVTEVRGE